MSKLLIIFGFTGDLIKKKVLFALHKNFIENQEEDFKILAVGRKDFEKVDLRNYIKEILGNDVAEEFLNLFYYEKIDFNQQKDFEKLNKYYISFSQIFIYLAVLPETILSILKFLPQNPNASIMVEKPIGFNKEDFFKIEQNLNKKFAQEQIFRLDHYLHKNIVSSIKEFRKNNILENLWNSKFIKKIHIKINETIDIEGRVEFYEKTGAFKDVGANHILNYLALIVAELDENLEIKDQSKEKILKNMEFIPNKTIVGQYLGYIEENHLDNTQTHTYFKSKLKIKNSNWYGTNIVLEAGKAMKKLDKSIYVKFFNGNYVKFDFSKDTSITINLGREIEYLHTPSESKKYVDEYAKAFKDFFNFKLQNFVTFEQSKLAWDIQENFDNLDKVLKTYPKNQIDTLKFPFKKIEKINIGIIGLGKMGMGMYKNLYSKGYRPIVMNRSEEKLLELSNFEGIKTSNLEEFCLSFPKNERKLIMLFLPSTVVNEFVLGTFENKGLIDLVGKKDIVADCGNSLWENSQTLAKNLKKREINFVDIGVSGGPDGARLGACTMVGGKKRDFETIKPILEKISVNNGFLHVGNVGMGHFVKMIHNAIEYGMMQSLAEGFEIIKQFDQNIKLTKVVNLYNNGSVIESRLTKWLLNAFLKHSENLDNISTEIEQNFETVWAVNLAKKISANHKAIEESLKFRFKSKQKNFFASKVISALRNEFGQHNVFINKI